MSVFKTVFSTCCFFLLFVSASLACSLSPAIDGADVLVPDLLIKEIPGYDATKPVYAATDVNGWFVRGSTWATDERKKATQMTKEGDCWRAKGLKGIRFHPVQLNSNSKPAWARLENLYPLDSSFIDNSSSSPCLKLN